MYVVPRSGFVFPSVISNRLYLPHRCGGLSASRNLRRPLSQNGGRTPSASQVTAVFEVEKKFPVEEKSLHRLRDAARIAQSPVKKELIQDTYFDTSVLALTLTDAWLRKRDARWELKTNARLSDRIETPTAVAVYEELEGEADVFSELCRRQLDEEDLVPFAILKTQRETFSLPTWDPDFPHVVVALDSCRALLSPEAAEYPDFHHSVGELEICVTDRGEVDAAESVLKKFLDEVGPAGETEAARGKLEEFIRLKRPEHYAMLVERHILRRHS